MHDFNNKKPTLGIFSINSCGGCQRQILSANELLLSLNEIVEIVHWELVSCDLNVKEVDIAIIEGAAKCQSDIDEIKKIAESAKVTVALGACACGLNHEYLNQDKKDSPVQSVAQIIDVDYKLRLCPIDTSAFINMIHKIIYSNNLFETTKTLCGDCKTNERGCFYGRGIACAGLISLSGCDSLCTKLFRPCYGCSGISPASSFQVAKKVQASSQVQDDKKLESLLCACDVERFIMHDISGLEGDDAVFCASRFSGCESVKNTIATCETIEKARNITVGDDLCILRSIAQVCEKSNSHLINLFCDIFPKTFAYDSMFDAQKENEDFYQIYFDLRNFFDFLLTKIMGRPVHPITSIIGGFTQKMTTNRAQEIAGDVDQLLNGAILIVDKFAQISENTSPNQDEEVLQDVLSRWDDLCDEARFAAAKAALRPPKEDARLTCVARCIDIVDALCSVKANLLTYAQGAK